MGAGVDWRSGRMNSNFSNCEVSTFFASSLKEKLLRTLPCSSYTICSSGLVPQLVTSHSNPETASRTPPRSTRMVFDGPGGSNLRLSRGERERDLGAAACAGLMICVIGDSWGRLRRRWKDSSEPSAEVPRMWIRIGYRSALAQYRCVPQRDCLGLDLRYQCSNRDLNLRAISVFVGN